MSLGLAVVEAHGNQAVISWFAYLSSEGEETALGQGPVPLGVVLGLYFRELGGSMGCWMRLECPLSEELVVPCPAEGPALVVEGQERMSV